MPIGPKIPGPITKDKGKAALIAAGLMIGFMILMSLLRI